MEMGGRAWKWRVPAVELQAVHKAFGDTEALRGIDLRIDPGEVLAVLGPNGAGKTTAISLMLGLRTPTSGRVRVFGQAPTSHLAMMRRGAMLQDSGVPALLTVRELVELFTSYYPSPLPVDRAIELAGLHDQARTTAAKLSGGQRQRLFFALAVCGDPEVLFLDEPTVAMDVASRRSFLGLIGDFARAGKTIVLTTHFMEEANEVAERIVVIDRGQVIADGTPAEIKSRASGRRVQFRSPRGIEPALLVGLPVSGLTLTGDEVRFLSNEPEQVLATLFRAGAEIADLEVTGADLEEAFLALTDHGEVAA
jgi:ABC-2 type transport system ATP-binding protein